MGGQASTYDRSRTQFNLDLSNATVTLRADGSRRVDGIVPLSTAETAMAGFAVNSRRWGTMSLTLGLKSVPATPSRHPSVLPVPPDPRKNGTNGRDATLTRHPAQEGAVRDPDRGPCAAHRPGDGKTVARGTAEGRTLRLGVLAGTKLKKGSYLLKRTAKKASGRKQAVVTLP